MGGVGEGEMNPRHALRRTENHQEMEGKKRSLMVSRGCADTQANVLGYKVYL